MIAHYEYREIAYRIEGRNGKVLARGVMETDLPRPRAIKSLRELYRRRRLVIEEGQTKAK